MYVYIRNIMREVGWLSNFCESRASGHSSKSQRSPRSFARTLFIFAPAFLYNSNKIDCRSASWSGNCLSEDRRKLKIFCQNLASLREQKQTNFEIAASTSLPTAGSMCEITRRAITPLIRRRELLSSLTDTERERAAEIILGKGSLSSLEVL